MLKHFQVLGSFAVFSCAMSDKMERLGVVYQLHDVTGEVLIRSLPLVRRKGGQLSLTFFILDGSVSLTRKLSRDGKLKNNLKLQEKIQWYWLYVHDY
jgi:hypothetical protein